MAPIPIFIKLGTAILRVAASQVKNLLKKGGKEIKNPSLKQKKDSIPLSQLGKDTKSPRGANVKTKGKKSDPNYKETPPRKELNPTEDIKLKPDLKEDLPFDPKEEKMVRHRMNKSGGMIKKNKMYAYGGRVAKYKG